MCSFQGTGDNSRFSHLWIRTHSVLITDILRIFFLEKKHRRSQINLHRRFFFSTKAALKLSNGDKEIRTPDPLLARQVLSQLSYTPMGIWQPPALPYRLQYSTIGRLGLNHRVRDENGCVPQAHRHQKCSYFGFLHRRCALRITTSSLSFFLIYLFGKSTVMQPLLLPFP